MKPQSSTRVAGAARRSPQALYELAMHAHREGRLADAAEALHALHRLDRRHPGVLHHLALVTQQMGQGAEALQLMRRASKLAPRDAVLRANYANLLRENGRAEEALAAYREALALDPGNATARYNLGTALSESGRHAEAEECFRRLLRDTPGDPRLATRLAAALIAQERATEASTLLEEVVAAHPGFAAAYNVRGTLRVNEGDAGRAEDDFRHALELDPAIAEAWYNLAVLHLGAGQTEEALCDARRALGLDPAYAQAAATAAHALCTLGRHDEALEMSQRALQLAPEAGFANFAHGRALADAGRPRPAIAPLAKAVAAEPEDVAARYLLATCLLNTGDHRGGLEQVEAILSRDPSHVGAWVSRSSVYTDRGDMEAARHAAERAVALDPDSPEAWFALATLKRYTADDTEEVERMERALEAQVLTDDQRSRGHFALAKIRDDLEQPALAIAHYRDANALQARAHPFKPQRLRATVDDLIATFDTGFLERCRGLPVTGGERAIFVVGVPRSGTTLVEQILASHPQVHGGGELLLLPDLVRALGRTHRDSGGYPRALPALSEAERRRLAAAHLEALRAMDTAAPRVTDKLPANFLHLGLVAWLLPGARVVHCRRNPMDVCLSNFQQRYATGNRWAYDLDWLGFFYREYRRLMAHWRAVLPPGMLFEVEYEALVADQEGVTRTLLANLDLPWSDACLAFHRHRRVVHTASHQQVRRPIYRSSVSRWRRYGAALDPLRAALGDVLEGEEG